MRMKNTFDNRSGGNPHSRKMGRSGRCFKVSMTLLIQNEFGFSGHQSPTVAVAR
jgi:hypothetical protein